MNEIYRHRSAESPKRETLRGSKARIQNSASSISDPVLKQQRLDVAKMILDNPDKIKKYLTVVNKTTGQINILKLGSY